MNIFSRTEPPMEEWTQEHPDLGSIHFKRTSKIKRIQVRVIPFQGIIVSFPTHSTKEAVENFLQKRTDWVWKSLTRAQTLERNAKFFFSSIEKPTQKAIRESLSERILQLSLEFGFKYEKLSFRNQKSRWGSCSSANNISLNNNLYYLPRELKDYVLLHELAHTKEKNHGHRFWQILFDILGQEETKKRRQNLKEFEFLFYPPKQD